jgi:T-lymphoma invasion and metastasis-inducing protein 1
LHCCCVIVQITPVAPGKNQVTTTAAVKKDAGDGLGSREPPVCRCNLRYNTPKSERNASSSEVVNQDASKSLDKLYYTPSEPIPPTVKKLEEQQPPKLLTNGELIKYLQQLNGDLQLVEKLKSIQAGISKDITSIQDKPKPQTQKQEKITSNKQQHSQILGDQNRLINSDQVILNGNINEWLSRPQKTQHSTQPQPPPRRSLKQKSNSKVEAPPCKDWLDRSNQQRHSSRSVDAATFRHRDQNEGSACSNSHHQRHSSGPSEIPISKKDISDLLLNYTQKDLKISENINSQSNKPNTPRKSDEQRCLKELEALFKEPLKRQYSGSANIDSLKKELLDWLTIQQNAEKKLTDQKEKPVQTKFQNPVPDQNSKPKSLPKLQKRHSLGPNEEVFINHHMPEWIQLPIKKEKQLALQSSCVDIHKKEKKSSELCHSERKLRHSASEVVTTSSNAERNVVDKRSRGSSRQTHYQLKLIDRSLLQSKTNLAETKPHNRPRDRSAAVQHVSQSFATVGEIRPSSSSPKTRCTDPMCPFLPVCTDPNCYLLQHYDTPRCASLPRSKETKKCTVQICQDYRCNSARCTDVRCMVSKTKSNSLPRCAETSSHHSNSHLTGIERGDSKVSLVRSSRSKSKTHGANGKLTKSVSAVSLNSRRRRHKTVHFGENLLREVCQNRKLIKPLYDTPSSTTPMQPNIQMLYNFVEGVLSAWVDDEEDEHNKSGPDSEPERGAILKPMHRCNRIRFQTIRRIVAEAAGLKGTLKLGNSRYRHRHWRGTAKDCNERFLKKVLQEDCWQLYFFFFHKNIQKLII